MPIRNSSLKTFLMSQNIGITLLFFLPSTGNLFSFASPFACWCSILWCFVCPSLLSIWQGFYIKASKRGLCSVYGKVKPGFLLCQGPKAFVHGGSSYWCPFSHSLSISFYLRVTVSYFLLASVQSLFLFLAQIFAWNQEVLTLWNLEST